MPALDDNRGLRRGDIRFGRATAIRANAAGLRNFLRKLTQPIQSFEALLSHAQVEDRARIDVPDEFLKAWLHLLMCLAYSTQTMDAWADHAKITETLIKTGMGRVIESLSTRALLDRAAVLPMEIASMACLNLFNDTSNSSHGISETYLEYLQALVRHQAPFVSPTV